MWKSLLKQLKNFSKKGNFIGPLQKTENRPYPKTGKTFYNSESRLLFPSGGSISWQKSGSGFLADIQKFLKKFGRIYYFLLKMFAPVMASAKYQTRLKSLLARHDETKTIVNLGSGPTVLHNRVDIINVDIFTFNEVDIVADAVNLPIKDHSVDVIFNTAMLEHVANSEKIIREMHRLLKPEGEFFCYLPSFSLK